ELPAEAEQDDSPGAAALRAALDRGDLDAADDAACRAVAGCSADELARALADELVPHLGAAGHAPIFLDQLRRVAPSSLPFALGLRSLVRELARESDARLTWQSARTANRAGSGEDLTDVLLGPPSPGTPESPFIIPTMSLVERSGLAADLLDGPTRSLDPARASRALARVAAWSMLQDDPESAPSGCSHCLTMPQAVLALAPVCRDPEAAVAVAATYVLGFRATLGRVVLDPAWEPRRPANGPSCKALTRSPADAAAAVWHAPENEIPQLVRALATRAALHPDAHLAKYTVACLDAARADP